MTARVHVTVVLVGDDASTRLGIRLALEGVGYKVVADVESAADAVVETLRLRPSLCLIDLSVSEDGMSASRQIRDRAPRTKIVIFTDDPTETDLFDAVISGASGYLAKNISAERLPAALQAVLDGEVTLPRMLEARLIEAFRSRELDSVNRARFGRPDMGAGLTAREVQVLDLIAEPLPTVVVARRLGISEVTVRRHVSSAIHKLGVRDRSGAIELLQREHRTGGPEARGR